MIEGGLVGLAFSIEDLASMLHEYCKRQNIDPQEKPVNKQQEISQGGMMTESELKQFIATLNPWGMVYYEPATKNKWFNDR